MELNKHITKVMGPEVSNDPRSEAVASLTAPPRFDLQENNAK